MSIENKESMSPIWSNDTTWQLSLVKDNASKTSALLVPGCFKPFIYNRLSAILKMYIHCPDYFVLFEPLTRAHATEGEIMQAKKNLIKARYPKFYKEVFEDAAETETEKL